MNRRHALGTLAAAGIISAIPENARASDDGEVMQLNESVTGPRINFAQADKVMMQLGLDAMVLGTGTNFQYVTGLHPVISRMGMPHSTFAIVMRREQNRLAVVTAAFTFYYTLSDSHKGSDIPAYLYTAPVGGLHEGEQGAVPLALFKDRKEEPVDGIERDRVAATESAFKQQGQSGTSVQALRKALSDLGLKKGRVAVDHTAVGALVTEAMPALAVTGAEDALRRIRPVKSPKEIVLMRQASAGNVAAAREALQTIRAGGSYRDLRAAFFSAAARRGHRGVFMVVDRVSDELYDNTFKEGQGMLIDCVSEYQGYHGDYGRTIVVGEPVKAMRRATSAIADAWDSVREKLKPGMKFSDIRELGQKALRNAGKSYIVPFNPHSVGLYHTDHVGITDLPQREDVVLEPGMILSIDCPLLETGVGGSAHFEDLTLITPDGSEPIHDTSDPVLIRV